MDTFDGDSDDRCVREIGPNDSHFCDMWAKWVRDDRYICAVCQKDTCPYTTWGECTTDDCPVHNTRFRESMRDLSRFMILCRVAAEGGGVYHQNGLAATRLAYAVLRGDLVLTWPRTW